MEASDGAPYAGSRPLFAICSGIACKSISGNLHAQQRAIKQRAGRLTVPGPNFTAGTSSRLAAEQDRKDGVARASGSIGLKSRT